MIEKSKPDWDNKVTSAYQKFFTTAAGAATSLVGLWSIASLLGWTRANSYYSALGAKWITTNLGLIEILALSSGPIIAFLIGILVTFIDFTKIKSKKNRATVLLALSIFSLIMVASIFYFKYWTHNYFLALTSLSFGLYLAASILGYQLGAIILETTKHNSQWRSNHIRLLFFYSFWYISFINMLGDTEGKRDANVYQTQLPIIETKSGHQLRLILEKEGLFYAGDLNPNRPIEIQVFNYENIKHISYFKGTEAKKISKN